jgi:hypothetical protein
MDARRVLALAEVRKRDPTIRAGLGVLQGDGFSRMPPLGRRPAFSNQQISRSEATRAYSEAGLATDITN